ncbi:MAG: hypothetical protein MJ084_01405 [Saccharofermentans sp.]|nr:hypothetical protein [Saccharofermentans sp.]
MRKGSTLVCIMLLLVAAVIGWFLPLAQFRVSDRLNEGKQDELEINKINLSYREELTMSQKLTVVQDTYNYQNAISLDSGIYIQEEELNAIVNEFIFDFCGRTFAIEDFISVTPFLFSLENDKGTAVIWSVDVTSEDGWDFKFFIDDQTGAILKCSIVSYSDYTWDELFNANVTVYDDVCNRFCTALLNHYEKRLNARLVNNNAVNTGNDDILEYSYIFRDEKNYTFQINLICDTDIVHLETYR